MMNGIKGTGVEIFGHVRHKESGVVGRIVSHQREGDVVAMLPDGVGNYTDSYIDGTIWDFEPTNDPTFGVKAGCWVERNGRISRGYVKRIDPDETEDSKATVLIDGAWVQVHDLSDLRPCPPHVASMVRSIVAMRQNKTPLLEENGLRHYVESLHGEVGNLPAAITQMLLLAADAGRRFMDFQATSIAAAGDAEWEALDDFINITDLIRALSFVAPGGKYAPADAKDEK